MAEEKTPQYLPPERLALYKALAGDPLVAALKKEMKERKVGPDSNRMREEYLKDIWENGGKGFVERVEKYGRTERGDKVKIDTWYAELLEGIADFRIAETFTMGCSQSGKTLSHTLLICDVLAYGRLNTGWFYATRTSMINQVAVQYQSTIEFYLQEMARDGIKFNRSRDRMTSERYMIENVTASFSYASTTKAAANNSAGLATVGGAAASFTADMLVMEERSQYNPGEADPLPRRVDASLIATKPIRQLSTPGSSGGIELGIKNQAQHDFYPHVICDYCGQDSPLHPKGALLKKFIRLDSTGTEIESYLSDTGRPQEWHHKDPKDPVGTAYIACVHCGEEISDGTRYNARMKCLKTGISFRDFIDSLPKGIPDKKHVVAFNISPLTRRSKINLAEDIIRSGLDATDTQDFIQQRLGLPSEVNANSITLDMLKRSMEAPRPSRVPELRLAGIDQGRGTYWLSIADIIPPAGWKDMSVEKVLEETYVNYVFMGDVNVNLVPEMLKQYKVTLCGMDNEPSRSLAAQLQRETVIELMDQISNLKDVVRKDYVEEGGEQIPCWKIRNEKFLNQVLLSFVKTADDGYPMARLPEEFTKWVANPADNSPLRHMMSPKYDSWTGKWLKSGSEPDHLYFCNVFLYSMYYIFLTRDMGSSYTPGVLATTEVIPSTSSGMFSIGARTRKRSLVPSRKGSFLGR